MIYRIYINGTVRIKDDISPDRLRAVHPQTLRYLPKLSERGRVLVTVDSPDNVTFILASKKAAHDLRGLSL